LIRRVGFGYSGLMGSREPQLGHYELFVRFRSVRHRLVVETRRETGKVRSEHIARLGSVALPEPISARERAAVGSYRPDGLIKQFGPDIALPDLLMDLAACEWRKDFSRSSRTSQPGGSLSPA
jgi:hypothetical protein